MPKLTIEFRVVEWAHDDNGKTHVRLELGNSCFMSFILPAHVVVPKYLTFTTTLEEPDSNDHSEPVPTPTDPNAGGEAAATPPTAERASSGSLGGWKNQLDSDTPTGWD